jgi:eukaryotic-like serine/threonine-protein kinase
VTTIDRYELLDRFATGGVAEIYRARDKQTGLVVVIKRMRPDVELTPDRIAMFSREMHVAYRANHKNLIRCFALGTHQNYDYGVLEYVDGLDLERIVSRLQQQRTAVPVEVATYVVSEVLDGLDYAHSMLDEREEPMRLVHRDVAPKNILLRYDGGVRIADFGMGLASAYEQLEDEGVVGTAGYMAPEQVERTSVDARTDLYATGIVLYEMLSGHRAIVASGSDADVLRAHKKPVFKPLPSHVPENLRMVVQIALSVDREDRFPTARDFRHAVHRSDGHHGADVGKKMLAQLFGAHFQAEFAKSRLPPAPVEF